MILVVSLLQNKVDLYIQHHELPDLVVLPCPSLEARGML
jgi:hypothetical protein